MKRLVIAAALALGTGPALAIDFGKIIDLGRQVATQPSAKEFSQEDEIALGEAATASFLGASPLHPDASLQRYVNRVGRWIALHSDRPDLPWTFSVIDTETINAFALPGGSIIVSSGLLKRLNSEAELAGVLAHEIQHVLHRDATRAILRQASTAVLVAALLGDVSGVLAFGVQSARTLGDFRHSRDAERAADHDGLAMLQGAGVDPAGMLAFFRAMEKLEGTQPAIAQYMSTHPASSERLQALSAAAAAGPHAPGRLLAGYDWSDIRKICGERARSAREREPAAPASR